MSVRLNSESSIQNLQNKNHAEGNGVRLERNELSWEQKLAETFAVVDVIIMNLDSDHCWYQSNPQALEWAEMFGSVSSIHLQKGVHQIYFTLLSRHAGNNDYIYHLNTFKNGKACLSDKAKTYESGHGWWRVGITEPGSGWTNDLEFIMTCRGPNSCDNISALDATCNPHFSHAYWQIKGVSTQKLNPPFPLDTNVYVRKFQPNGFIGWIPNDESPRDEKNQHFLFGEIRVEPKSWSIVGMIVGGGNNNYGYFMAKNYLADDGP